MRYFIDIIKFFISKKNNLKNLRILRYVLGFIFVLIALYSVLFHYIMEYEGRDYSPFTGIYWTMTVLSTLGFGDITFNSDLGKIFTMVVLLSGIFFIMLTLPFMFIRFVYTPWLEGQASASIPRKAPDGMKGHAILVGSDDIAQNISNKLDKYHIPYCMLVGNHDEAESLNSNGYSVVLGNIDDIRSYEACRAKDAALVFALLDDFKNTNIASTVRELSLDTTIAATADSPTADSVLHLAGCDKVYNFTDLLGRSLARRVHNIGMQSNIIARFEELCIAEAPTQHSSLAGQTVMDASLKERFGVNIIGVWQGNQFMSVKHDTAIDEGAVLLLAGTADHLDAYDRGMKREAELSPHPVIILGRGRVGSAVAQALEERQIDFRVVDKNPKVQRAKDDRFILGDASDYEVLEHAGIGQTNSVVVTTHNDDLNIYLSIFCRKLRPDIQLLSRATLDRNIASLYNAGASLVMSQASLTANTIINMLHPDQVFMLTEGVNVFRIKASGPLLGKNLVDSHIREETGCNVVAVRAGENLLIPPETHRPFEENDELIIIGTSAEEAAFHAHYSPSNGKK